MKINILKGYVNGFSNENNSVSLRINCGDELLKNHVNTVIKQMNKIYDVIYDFAKKHEYIIFYHTFRLSHHDKDYLMSFTYCKGCVYMSSEKIVANKYSLKDQLKNSLNDLSNLLNDYIEGWRGVHFINITMKNKVNETIKLEDNERQKIKMKHKPIKFEFIDENNDENEFEKIMKKNK